MPRKARIDAPGALNHIVVRGIERKPIFRDSRDYETFLDRLGKVLGETATPCYAFALLPNHVHLLLRTGSAPLSTAMRRLLTGYALQFNRRHRRFGHLYQNRYKSFLCEEEPYFLELVRYIHLNPLRAGLARDLDELKELRTTGHSAIMGKIEREWQDVDYVLNMFGRNRRSARAAYRDFVSHGIALGQRHDLVGGGLVRSAGGWSALKKTDARVGSDERILGSGEFVTSVLAAANENYEKRTLAAAMGITIETLIDAVGERLGVNQPTIRSPIKERPAAQARAIICHLGVDLLRVTGVEIAGNLGLSPSAICKLANRGRNDPLSSEIWDNLLARRI